MHLLIIGGNYIEAEFRQKFGEAHSYTFWEPTYLDQDSEENKSDAEPEDVQLPIPAGPIPDAIFFFKTDGYWNWNPSGSSNCVVFYDSSAQRLPGALGGLPTFGFCGLPTLLNRPLLEVSLYKPENAPQLAEICAALGTDYRVVQDRLGLVTPRVLCMIINEACYALQEGTASIQDIDKSMKLGTSYPRGPFEWANLIGAGRVYDVLESLWQDTHEERYKVCPLLKTMYLRGESFKLT